MAIDEKRYTDEIERLVDVLGSLMKSRRLSVRGVERRMKVGETVFNKVLKGKVTPNLRHILMICDGLEMSWQEFFALAYPPPPAADPRAEFDAQVRAALIRLGLLDENGALIR